MLIGIVIGITTQFLPSLQRQYLLPLFIVEGIWAALCLWVLLPGAQRTHQYAAMIAISLAVALSIFTGWFGIVAFLLAYYGCYLFAVIVLVFAALRVFRKKPSVYTLLIPLTMIMMGVCGGWLSALLAKPVPPIPQQAMSTSEEVKYIRDTDQADRLSMRWAIFPERDQIRLQRMKALYGEGKITEPADQYAAALVYQHGTCADEFQVAYELASAADAHGVPPHAQFEAGTLVHAAYDRWQMSLGRPQRYGTQLSLTIPMKRPCSSEK